MKRVILLSLLLISLLLLAGCTKSISDIKNEDYLDKKVSLRGEVTNTIKLGDLSGYTITDSSGESIFVSSNELPAEGVKRSVRGTVNRLPIIGTYYIDTK